MSFIDDMAEFCNELGLSQGSPQMPITLDEIMGRLEQGFTGNTTEEIELFLFTVHSFNLKIKNKKSSLKAYVGAAEKEINSFVDSNIDEVDRFLPYDSKKRVIISNNEKLTQKNRQLTKATAQLEKIGDIPYSLDKVIASIENYLRRRHTQ